MRLGLGMTTACVGHLNEKRDNIEFKERVVFGMDSFNEDFMNLATELTCSKTQVVYS
jgi:hypothetical protein